ncbi:MAG: aspartate aminotransferase family protein, partial [Alphaproteobacteria bacterium PA3]
MDKEFAVDPDGLRRAVELMGHDFSKAEGLALPREIPPVGMGSTAALNALAPSILGGAARLGEATSFAHMDPPTPWITWAMTLWNASLNQNLLHPATSPVARQMEERVVAWLAPFFGMNGGHMTPGSTVANLTALWAARECAGVTEVVASAGAHLSIAKAAHILGLKFRSVPTDANGSMDATQLPIDLRKSALVLTAGATSTGAIDPLDWAGRAAWTHVDAAWAGPLRLSV